MSKLERVVFIDHAVRTRGFIRLSDIVEEFSISSRQAARDIDYLRYSCGAPLDYNAPAKSYRYSEPFNDFDFLEEDALLSRVLIHRLALSSPFIPLNATEIDRRLEGFIPARLVPLETTIRFELSSFEPVNRPLVSAIMVALSEKRRIAIKYTDISGKNSERSIEPRRLVNYSGAWYCYAVDVEKSAIRNFKLSRVGHFCMLEEHHTSSFSEEELDSLIDNSYGAYKGTVTTKATIRFYGHARSIVEHEIWHPEQAVAEGIEPDGREYMDLTIPIYRFEELLGRVLRFGSNAMPMAPSELQDAWKDEIMRMHSIISEV